MQQPFNTLSRIITRSTSSATMEVNPIVLRQTSTTRLVFAPTWVEESDNSLRGSFRFEKKSPISSWESVEHQPLSSLKMNEGYELTLKGDEISLLLSRLGEINIVLSKYGHSIGSRAISLNINNAQGVFVQIGDISNRDWVISKLKELERENFENLGAAIGRARLENVISVMETNMTNNLESFWQKFFEDNSWVLQQIFNYPVIYLQGETYLGGKNTKGRQGSGGTATDFLFKNGSNGSFAVVEIKTPGCSLVGSVYRGQGGSENKNEIYTIHNDLTGGVVQLENQVYVATEYFKTQIGNDFSGLNHLNAIGLLIAGNSDSLSESQKRSFDLFRKSLGKNQILTFNEVLERLKLFKTVYEN